MSIDPKAETAEAAEAPEKPTHPEPLWNVRGTPLAPNFPLDWTAIPWGDLIRNIGFVGLLTAAIYGSHQGVWVWGTDYNRLRTEFVEYKLEASQGLDAMRRERDVWMTKTFEILKTVDPPGMIGSISPELEVLQQEARSLREKTR